MLIDREGRSRGSEQATGPKADSSSDLLSSTLLGSMANHKSGQMKLSAAE